MREGSAVKRWLLFQRTRIQFSAPTWWFTTNCNSSSRESYVLFWPLWTSGTHIMHRHVYKIYKILAKATFFCVKHRTALHTRLFMKRRERRQIHKEVLRETCTPSVWTGSYKERKLKHFCLSHHLVKINSIFSARFVWGIQILPNFKRVSDLVCRV